MYLCIHAFSFSFFQVEGLRKHQELEIQRAKEFAEAEAKKLLRSLKQDLASKGLEAEQYQTQLLSWERKLETTAQLIRKQQLDHAAKEDEHHQVAAGLNDKIRVLKVQNGLLTKQKEALRHKVLKMRLEMEGKVGQSLESTLARLAIDTERLKVDNASFSETRNLQLQAQEVDKVELERSKTTIASLEDMLAKQTAENKRLEQTFQRFLHRRFKANQFTKTVDITLEGAKSKLSDEIAKAIGQLSDGRHASQTNRSFGGFVSGRVDAVATQASDDEDKPQSTRSTMSRGARLHNIVKKSSLLPASSTIRETLADGKEEAKLDLESSEEDEDDQGVSKQQQKIRRFQVPQKLRELQMKQQLVDLAGLKDLEAGLDALNRFKRLSKMTVQHEKGNSLRVANGTVPRSTNLTSQDVPHDVIVEDKKSLSELTLRLYKPYSPTSAALGWGPLGSSRPMSKMQGGQGGQGGLDTPRYYALIFAIAAAL